MATVLVTGATGKLGRHLVSTLMRRGHTVRALVRRRTDLPGGVETAPGDVRTGQGLPSAFKGVETVIHAATDPFRRARRTETEGILNVARLAAEADAHLIYVSIVGADRIRLPYYAAKWDAEQLLMASSARWTIQRATQFHELLDAVLGPVFLTTRRLAFQPVAASDVAARLAAHVDAGPQGRATDICGPAILSMRELADARRRVIGARTMLVRVPALGPLRDFDHGLHLCRSGGAGRLSWETWLAGRHAGSGRVGTGR